MSTDAPRGGTRRTRRVRTPTLLQMEAVECGAAALGSIMAYHGRIVPLAELRRECGVDRDGSQASNVVAAARRYGMVARGFKKEVDDLQAMTFPVVVFWNFNHFVVVDGFGRDRVYLNDPASGPRTVSLAEFGESYTGIVLSFEPGPDFVRAGRRPSTVAALRERLAGSMPAITFAILAGLLLAIPGLVLPAFIQMFVDNVLIQRFDDWIRPLVLGLAIVMMFRALLMVLQLRILRRLQLKLAVVQSSRFLWHLLTLPAGFYAQRYAGEVASRIGLNDTVAEALSGRLTRTVIDVTMMALYAIVMFYYDVTLTLVGLAAAGANLVAVRLAARARVDANLHLLQEQGKSAGIALAGLQSMDTLKASALESDFFSRWAGSAAKALGARQDLALARLRLGLLPTLLSTATSTLVLLAGGLRVIDGTMTIGMLVAFQSLMQSFLGPANSLVELGGTLQELQGDLSRLDDVLQNPAKEHSTPAPGAPARLRGAVELRGVTFGYTRRRPPLIENFSMVLRPGDRVAVVGTSGSGKSTLIRLLTGQYVPWSGDILLDGRPLASLPRDVLANSVTLVEQDISLFRGTTRDNLTLWDPTLRDADLAEACDDALVRDVVRELPGGFDGQLLEGAANLSGGQRQRLEIARALATRPSIVVLDEATSALDAETERIVMDNLRRRGCTCVSVAHRVSAIRDADEIIVLHGGKVVERGSHADLLAARGEYARLIAAGDDGAPA